MVCVEQSIYSFMDKLVPDYRGAFWDFHELSNGGFYMAPQLRPLKPTLRGSRHASSLSAISLSSTTMRTLPRPITA